MKKKSNLGMLCVIGLVLGNVLAVSAGSTTHYGPTYITKTSDYISGTTTKEELTAASNLVENVEGNRSLCCWIENANGTNLTDKPSYDDEVNIYMNYSDAKTAQGKEVRIRISTTLSNFTSTDTMGWWNPDYITYVE